MLRFGTIKEFDNQKYLAKVLFDEDGIESGWLQVLTRGSQDVKDEFPMDKGAMVACITDQYMERGVVLGCAYNDKDETDAGASDIFQILYSDGSIEKYDQRGHVKTFKIENAELVISRDGFAVKRSSETLKKIISDLIDQIKLLTVTTPNGPSGTPINATAFTAIKNRLPNLFTE